MRRTREQSQHSEHDSSQTHSQSRSHCYPHLDCTPGNNDIDTCCSTVGTYLYTGQRCTILTIVVLKMTTGEQIDSWSKVDVLVEQ